jgi:hypothetical protein
MKTGRRQALKRDQDKRITQQQEQIDVLTAGLQRVTARVEAANSALRVVSDN